MQYVFKRHKVIYLWRYTLQGFKKPAVILLYSLCVYEI